MRRSYTPPEHPRKASFVLQYRTFRNYDPPHLMEVWNESLSGRGAVRLRHASRLDHYIFSKPYFDPAGVILAFDGDQCVGFAHAGFGPNDLETSLDPQQGVICLVCVRPSHRRRGIGSELLHRCEEYLKAAGVRSLHAGPLRPLGPFYFGLLGGSDLAGFLDSEPSCGPFLAKHGYEATATRLVLQRQMIQPLAVDGRFPALRQQFEVTVTTQHRAASWWQECILGPVEVIEFRLDDRKNGQSVARTTIWEMEEFSWRWNAPSVGLLDVQVVEGRRRQGLARFLLWNILRYLQDNFFGIVEVHADQHNEAALKLFQGLGFKPVDVGRHFIKTSSAC